MKKIGLKILAILSLISCLILAYLNFRGKISAPHFKLAFLLVSFAYFILATLSLSPPRAS